LPTVVLASSSVSAFGPSAKSYTVGRPGVSTPGGYEREHLAHDLAENLRRGLDQDADVQADHMHLVGGNYQPYGICVLTVTGAGIRRISSFGDPSLVTVFGF
jgi:hypothetical protein